jgi:hypothetical protein
MIPYPKLTRTVLVAALTLGVAQAADHYQIEGALGYSHSDSDDTDNSTSDTVYASGTYYFAPVALDGRPWEETAFLDRHSEIHALAGWVTGDSDTLELDGPTVRIGGRYAAQDTPVTVAAEVGYTKIEDGDVDVELKTTDFMLEAGYYIQPNLLAGARYVGIRSKLDGLGTSLDFDGDAFSLFGKYLHDFGNSQFANVDLEVGRASTDDGTTDGDNTFVAVAGDYYFSPQYGIGPVLSNLSGDDDATEGFEYGVRGSAWFTPQFGVRAEVTQFVAKDEDVGEDNTLFTVEGVVRF